MMVANKEDVCVLLDKLTLEMLSLIEQEVQCKMNIEKSTKDASVELARTRYVKGQKTVSVLQLPSEKSAPFAALATVTESQDNEQELSDSCELNTRPADKDAGEVDPLRWFGVLVPQSLQSAQRQFKQALTYIVECRNIQTRLHETMGYITSLNVMKETM